MPHLIVATPAYGGQVTTIYMDSLMKLQRACFMQGIDFNWLALSGDALITRARADLVAHFLERPTATHLLFIDADIAFEPEQAIRLMEFDADMTAACYPIKAINWERVRSVMASGAAKPQSAALTYVFEVDDPSRIAARDGFARVRYAGTGFLMIRRGALMQLCSAYPELQFRRANSNTDPLRDSQNRFALFECLIDPATGTYLSEDFAFCKRWTDLGGEIWLDTESKLTHIGPLAFTGDFTTQFAPAMAPAMPESAL